jgi:hypothetical protein
MSILISDRNVLLLIRFTPQTTEIAREKSLATAKVTLLKEDNQFTEPIGKDKNQ